jgi:hypothetical protein
MKASRNFSLLTGSHYVHLNPVKGLRMGEYIEQRLFGNGL